MSLAYRASVEKVMSGSIEPKTQRWVLALTSTASLMIALDVLVVATALDQIGKEFGAGVEPLQWTINAYTLTFAVLLMTATVAGDRYGRRRIFILGLVVFAMASAGCALAANIGLLMAARRSRRRRRDLDADGFGAGHGRISSRAADVGARRL